jgi:hypothetical protein
MRPALFALCLALLPLPSGAEPLWTPLQISPALGGGAGMRLEPGDGRAVELMCFDAAAIRFTLFGGPAPMPGPMRGMEMALTFDFAPGPALPALGDYIDGGENAIIGSFAVPAGQMAAIGAAGRLRILGPDGQPWLDSPMQNAPDLARAFGQACGM